MMDCVVSERALYSCESSFHPCFNLAQGNCRLEYRIWENRFVSVVIPFSQVVKILVVSNCVCTFREVFPFDSFQTEISNRNPQVSLPRKCSLIVELIQVVPPGSLSSLGVCGATWLLQNGARVLQTPAEVRPGSVFSASEICLVHRWF